MKVVEKPTLSIDETVRANIQCDFNETAGQIVRHVREIMQRSLSGDLKKSMDSLSKTEIDQLSNELALAFQNKKMGLRELASLARKEFSILLIRKSIPKYRSSMMKGGINPLEYFDRFYKDSFLVCDVPANGISIVDPNLHTLLKKRGEFPAITRSLGNG